MTIEEQLHRVAHLLQATASLALRNEQAINRVVELQEVESHSLTKMAETFEAAHKRLAAAVAGYVADSRERMKQLEALDARSASSRRNKGKGTL
jgi:hypothetical protein